MGFAHRPKKMKTGIRLSAMIVTTSPSESRCHVDSMLLRCQVCQRDSWVLSCGLVGPDPPFRKSAPAIRHRRGTMRQRALTIHESTPVSQKHKFGLVVPSKYIHAGATLMSSGRSNKLTAQIGEYLVCAELARREFIATSFSGNVPTFDVLATDDQCRTVPIQVRASRSGKWPSDAREWMEIDLDPQTNVQCYRGPRSITNPDLIYVCVSISPPEGDLRDRYFILTKAQLQEACIKCYEGWMAPRQWKRPRNPQSFDCRYNVKDILPYLNNWKLIEERLLKASPDLSLASDTIPLKCLGSA
jgi:hypothetical protein